MMHTGRPPPSNNNASAQGPHRAPAGKRDVAARGQATKTGGAPDEDEMVTFKPVEPTGISWDDLVGVDKEKTTIRQAMEAPIRFPQLFPGRSQNAYRGFLMYGPPGTGKTLLAQATAEASGAAFFSVLPSDLMEKYVGGSEGRVTALFDAAKSYDRSVIFVDECDNLFGDHAHEVSMRVKNQFLTEMDMCAEKHNIVVIGATNLPLNLDEAIAQYFTRELHIKPPSGPALAAMFKKKLETVAVGNHPYDLYAQKMAGCTGAEVVVALKQAMSLAIKPVTRAQYYRFDMASGKHVPCEKSDAGSFARASIDTSKLVLRLEIKPEHVLQAIDIFKREQVKNNK